MGNLDLNNFIPDFDDKDLGIMAITIIAVVAMFKLDAGQASTIATACVSGIAGFVTGNLIDKKK